MQNIRRITDVGYGKRPEDRKAQTRVLGVLICGRLRMLLLMESEQVSQNLGWVPQWRESIEHWDRRVFSEFLPMKRRSVKEETIPKNYVLTSISEWSPTRANIPSHIPPITRAVSRGDSLTPSWMSSRPRKSARPPRSSALVSAAIRVLVLRLENKRAIVLGKSDCEGSRMFFLVAWDGTLGRSHGWVRFLRA